MFSYFVLCFELSQLIPTKCNKVQQRTCLLMASAAGIETSKNATDENEKMRILNDVVSYIQKCERIYQESVQDQPQSGKTDLTLPMLICLEFEAKARLGYKSTETIIDKAKDLHSIDAKTFETIAATALEISPKHNPEGIKALKMAIKCHLEDQRTDYLQLSKDLHTLVNISINEGGNSNPQSKEETYQYYQNILEIIQKAPKNSYPEMEILWLMTKAWNCGVHLFSAHEFDACERWCGMAMKFLDQLDTLKSNYTSHMTSVFAEILEKRERTSIRSQVEE
ncbi:testis-expressed protein 11-like [Rhopilema esculentum]|uniref:testis-expressed protein 11-like n=1 Tax=Rhopilema esculentum TaxID=499914 RepID=UPI0031E22E16